MTPRTAAACVVPMVPSTAGSTPPAVSWASHSWAIAADPDAPADEVMFWAEVFGDLTRRMFGS